jgi:hypothetical protein
MLINYEKYVLFKEIKELKIYIGGGVCYRILNLSYY